MFIFSWSHQTIVFFGDLYVLFLSKLVLSLSLSHQKEMWRCSFFFKLTGVVVGSSSQCCHTCIQGDLCRSLVPVHIVTIHLSNEWLLSSLPPYKDCSSQCSHKGWSLSPSPSSSPPHISSSRPPARSTLKSEKCQLAEKVLENFFRRRRVMTIESDNQWGATWASAVEKLYNLWKFANLFFSASNGRASSIKTW